jgi:hypothetical protein
MRSHVFSTFILMLTGLMQTANVSLPISSSPLNREQVAVYKAALLEERRFGSYELVSITGMLQPDEGDYATCMKGFSPSSVPTQSHRLPQDVAATNHMRLTDPEESATDSGSMNCRLTLSEVIFDQDHRRAAVNRTVICKYGGDSHTVVYSLRHGEWKHSADCASGIS